VLASGLLASVRVATGAKTPVVLLLITAFSVLRTSAGLLTDLHRVTE